ncbi:MAG TPA: inositol monophosphatase family protein [Acidimicrobiia bacterium]
MPNTVASRWGDDLSLAHELCDLADTITTARFRARDLHVDTKPDLTPVSEADHAVEVAIRERLERDRAGDAIIGEELGATGESARRWIVDPIDGTKSYVRGVPAWATLLALEADGELVVGVVSAPALGRRWWAARGGGAFADGEPIRVSEVQALEDAQLCFANFRDWEPKGLGAAMLALAGRVWRALGFGDFWGHMLVAEGAADVMIEPELALWDVAALRPIVEEAGGRCTDLAGAPAAGPGGCVTTNALLHDDVLGALGASGAAT